MVFNNKQAGFTITELMIAMGVFAVAMTLILGGVITIGRQYKQASTRVNLESASREVHQQLNQSIQFTGYDPLYSVANNGWKSFCTGTQRYTFSETNTVSNTGGYDGLKSGLYVNTVAAGTCSVPESGVDNDIKSKLENILPPGAKVVYFNYDDNSKSLTTKFVSSDSDLLSFGASNLDISCKASVAGKEFCAVVQLSSTVIKRVF